MVKDITYGLVLIGVVFLLVFAYVNSLLADIDSNVLNHYFCSRIDTSYNVSVSYKDENIVIMDKNGYIKEFDLAKTIDRLSQATSHRLILSVLDKLKRKIRFNFRVDNALQICGFYKSSVVFEEVFTFKGNTNIQDLFEFITSRDVGWKCNVQQDEDLVYTILFLFVKNYFKQYVFTVYKEFIVIGNPKWKNIYRLDIDLKKVFGIDVENEKGDYLIQIIKDGDYVWTRGKSDSFKFNITTIFVPFTNSIAKKLSKAFEVPIRKRIIEEKIEELKNVIDIKDIKSDEQFMDLLQRVKTDPQVISMLPTDDYKNELM